MRILRIACVIVFCLIPVQIGHEPQTAPLVHQQVLDVLHPGLRSAAWFWYQRTGDQREGLSMPADARHLAIYQRAVRRAKKFGFVFDAPRLRQTRPELVLILGPGIRYVFAMHYTGPRIILVNAWWSEQMSDRELEMLFAHEIAHAIDVQNERRGNPYLRLFSAQDDDEFVADILAMMMFKPGEYRVFLNTYPDGKER